MKLLIWQIRNKKNISLEQLAQLTQLSKSALNNYENGKVSPTLEKLKLIAIALNVKITDLFEDDYK
jgi:transcriptional regulator with XRE-family HTH domain